MRKSDKRTAALQLKTCVKIAILSAILLVCVAGLAACDRNDDPPLHKHSYERRIITEPTCAETGKAQYVCKCGDVYEEMLDRTDHHYAMQSDENAHWGECINCGYRQSEQKHAFTLVTEVQATCTQRGQKVYACDCGYGYSQYTETAPHSYTEYRYDGENHWLVCRYCLTQQPDGAKQPHNLTYQTVSPDCTHSGYVTAQCACGYYSTTQIAATGHTFDSITVTETHHIFVCTTCNKQVAEPHEWENTNSASNVAPTCNKDGQTQQKCKVCNNVRTVTIAATGEHRYENAHDQTYHWRQCAQCGNKTDMGLHDYVQTDFVAPTCTQNGQITDACSTCGYARTQSVDMTGHNLVQYKESALNTAYAQCTACGKYFDPTGTQELSPQDIFTQPQTDKVQQLKELASAQFNDKPGKELYTVALKVAKSHETQKRLRLYDTDERNFVDVQFDIPYNIGTINPGDIVTLSGYLVCRDNAATLENAKILSVDDGKTDTHSLFVTLKDSDEVSTAVVFVKAGNTQYETNSYNYNCIENNTAITLWINLTAIGKSATVTINGKIYDVITGNGLHSIKLTVTTNINITIEISDQTRANLVDGGVRLATLHFVRLTAFARSD